MSDYPLIQQDKFASEINAWLKFRKKCSLSPCARLAFEALLSEWNEDKQKRHSTTVEVKIEDIMLSAGYTDKETVRIALEELQREGYIDIHKRQGKPSVYTLYSPTAIRYAACYGNKTSGKNRTQPCGFSVGNSAHPIEKSVRKNRTPNDVKKCNSNEPGESSESVDLSMDNDALADALSVRKNRTPNDAEKCNSEISPKENKSIENNMPPHPHIADASAAAYYGDGEKDKREPQTIATVVEAVKAAILSPRQTVTEPMAQAAPKRPPFEMPTMEEVLALCPGHEDLGQSFYNYQALDGWAHFTSGQNTEPWETSLRSWLLIPTAWRENSIRDKVAAIQAEREQI